MKKLVVIFIFLLTAIVTFAQSSIKFTIPLEVKDTTLFFEDSCSSIVLNSSLRNNFSSILIEVDSVLYSFSVDYELSTEGNYWTQLLVFPSSSRSIRIKNNSESEFNIYCIQVKPLKLELPNENVLKTDACNSPTIISQSSWRAGLVAPDYERIYTETKNIIIHHSAGSNTDTEYVNVVRNIYVYHTITREWSDIGYNYLISQDGSIFAGRDPDVYPQDMVQGAHFSGSNANTMGICVLGNYEEVIVPDKAIESLVDLLTWKCAQDSLLPYGISSHPLNNSLPVIAGHREGGATLCPGENLYNDLPLIRDNVAENLRNCGFDIPSKIFYVPLFYSLIDEVFDVYSIDGKYIQTCLYSEINLNKLIIIKSKKNSDFSKVIFK